MGNKDLFYEKYILLSCVTDINMILFCYTFRVPCAYLLYYWEGVDKKNTKSSPSRGHFLDMSTENRVLLLMPSSSSNMVINEAFAHYRTVRPDSVPFPNPRVLKVHIC